MSERGPSGQSESAGSPWTGPMAPRVIYFALLANLANAIVAKLSGWNPHYLKFALVSIFLGVALAWAGDAIRNRRSAGNSEQ